MAESSNNYLCCYCFPPCLLTLLSQKLSSFSHTFGRYLHPKKTLTGFSDLASLAFCISRAILGVSRNRRTPTEENQSSEPSKFLNKGLLAQDASMEEQEEPSSLSHMEERKAFVPLSPISATSLAYTIVSAQTMSFFTKQGVTMDRTISAARIQIPVASLQTFTGFAIIFLIPVYDRVFIPTTRYLTGNSSGEKL